MDKSSDSDSSSGSSTSSVSQSRSRLFSVRGRARIGSQAASVPEVDSIKVKISSIKTSEGDFYKEYTIFLKPIKLRTTKRNG